MKIKIKVNGRGRKECLPGLAVIHTVDPEFTLADFRAIQAGEAVEVSDAAAAYLLQWCEKVDAEE